MHICKDRHHNFALYCNICEYCVASYKIFVLYLLEKGIYCLRGYLLSHSSDVRVFWRQGSPVSIYASCKLFVCMTAYRLRIFNLRLEYNDTQSEFLIVVVVVKLSNNTLYISSTNGCNTLNCHARTCPHCNARHAPENLHFTE